MKVQKVALSLIALMFLFAGVASAQQVKTDYDRGTNFAQYKTYSADPQYVLQRNGRRLGLETLRWRRFW